MKQIYIFAYANDVTLVNTTVLDLQVYHFTYDNTVIIKFEQEKISVLFLGIYSYFISEPKF